MQTLNIAAKLSAAEKRLGSGFEKSKFRVSSFEPHVLKTAKNFHFTFEKPKVKLEMRKLQGTIAAWFRDSSRQMISLLSFRFHLTSDWWLHD